MQQSKKMNTYRHKLSIVCIYNEAEKDNSHTHYSFTKYKTMEENVLSPER